VSEKPSLRQLEPPGSLYISKFWTGIYTNRSPLFTPVSAMGLQLLAHQDVFWDGHDVQCTPQFSCRRRYGFLRECPTAFAAGEWPLAFFSFQNLAGTVTPIVDTQLGVYSFSSTGLTQIYAKTTATQSSFNDIGDIMYWVDGSVFLQWNGTTVSTVGVIPPSAAPTFTTTGGLLAPTVGYKWGFVYRNPTSFQISSMSPASALYGPYSNVIIEEDIVGSGPYTVTVANAAAWTSQASVTGSVVYTGTGIALLLTDGTPTTGQYTVAAGVYTFSSGDSGAAVTITYNTGVSFQVSGVGSGQASVGFIDLYRTADGGAQYYFDQTIPNPGAVAFTINDTVTDALLNDFRIAPVAYANNPPPPGLTLLCWYAGRLWGASGNTLYFSGGPDTTNGVGAESWPPGNNYTIPGGITCLTPTSQGLIISTSDDLYVTTGTTLATFTVPIVWQANSGVPNQNCMSQDGDSLYMFTTRGCVISYVSGAIADPGSFNATKFGAFDPATTSITVHRSGEDTGIFVSDGVSNLWRFDQNTNQSWDTPYIPVGGVGLVFSMELVKNEWVCLIGRPTGAGYILGRDTNTWTDDGVAYSCSVTFGSITVAPPRHVVNLGSILLQVTGVGTYPTVSVLLNEIADTGKFPATFVVLPNPKPDPPQLPPTQSIWTRRHDFKAAQSPLCSHVQHLQLKVDFIAEPYPNELLGFGIETAA
jgi:hypothetical protein